MPKGKSHSAQKNKKKGSAAANPFEFKKSKPKHQVANERAKSHNVIRSRTEGLQQRQSTIALEMGQQGKKNKFVDRRIGEDDPNVSQEDKLLIRFQKTRQRQISKGDSIFNLNDEEEYTLTHRGKALAEGQEEGDDYGDDDDMSVDSVDEEREKDQSSLGFGGLHLKRAPQQQNGEDDDDMSSIEVPDDDDYDSDLEDGNLRKKSKREIMAELIGKSKRFKYEKQREREERMEETDMLNDQLPEILDLLKSNKRKTGQKEEEDEYDKLVASLSEKGVRKAKPQDPLKSEEDIAKFEAERLFQLERMRLKRMHGEIGEDEVDISSSNKKKRKRDDKPKRAPSADDLDDDSAKYLPPPSDSEDEDQEEEESEEMEEDGEGEESGEEGEEDGEAESGESGEDDDADDDDEQGIEEYLMGDLENADDLEDAPDLGKSGRDRKEARNNFSNLGLEADEVTHLEPEEELPFVFGMPSTFEGFTQLLSNQSADRQKKIIGRLRASNHPSLHPNNKDKMKLFYTYLLQRVMYLAGSEGSASGIKMDQVDVLCAPLFELSQSMPEYAAEVARDFIVQIDESFKAKLADGSSDSAAPRLQWLLMFKMLGQIWPVSDKRHGVVTPLFLLMGQMLSMSRIANMADVMKLLLLSNIFHSFICEAKRYSAEPLNVLFTVLDSFSKDNGKPNLAGPILSPLAQLPTGLMKLACKKAPTYKPRIINIDRLRPKAEQYKSKSDVDTKSPDYVSEEDKLKIDVLNTTINILRAFLDVYSEDSSFIEVQAFAKSRLVKLPQKVLPSSLAKYVNDMIGGISSTIEKMASSRVSLTLLTKKKEALKELTPDFEEHYWEGKVKSKDKQTRERKKLQKRLKSEHKGAERELKRDAQFIESQRRNKKFDADQKKEAKYKEVMTFLQQQQAQINKDSRMNAAAAHSKRRSVIPL